MSSSLPTVDLRPDHWEIIREILQRQLPSKHVFAFGSRATWTAKDYSDLDLAIMGEQPLSLSVLSALNEDFIESDLPFSVDIVDFASVDDSFRAIIQHHGVSV
ncbi:MAG: nucleotidyltransferase domain-containing protein, partial [Bacteroidota bacterium]|nr:nucleotidyltransferase domain-containing protein [Bacteroidota bacterium]